MQLDAVDGAHIAEEPRQLLCFNRKTRHSVAETSVLVQLCKRFCIGCTDSGGSLKETRPSGIAEWPSLEVSRYFLLVEAFFWAFLSSFAFLAAARFSSFAFLSAAFLSVFASFFAAA